MAPLSSEARQRLGIACASHSTAAEIETLSTEPDVEVGYKVDGVQVVGAQGAAVADLAINYTGGNPNLVPNSVVVVANGAAPTVAELLEAVGELTAKLNTVLARLRAHGLIDT